MQVPPKVLAVLSNVSLVVKLVKKGDNYRFPFYSAAELSESLCVSFYFSLYGLFSNNETVTGTMQNHHQCYGIP